MMNLILPICGKSTRYPNVPPKWSIEHNGKTMLEHSIAGLPLEIFSNIIIVALKKHETYIKKININNNWQIVLLQSQTRNQPETVYEGIRRLKLNGSIAIKDCDNYFKTTPIEDNFVTYYNLSGNIHNAENKSYIQINQDSGFIANIVEKRVISNTFCCGMYGFKEAQEYIDVYYKFWKHDYIKYISNIIFTMLLEKTIFKPIQAFDYKDWGTLEDWNLYIGKQNEN